MELLTRGMRGIRNKRRNEHAPTFALLEKATKGALVKGALVLDKSKIILLYVSNHVKS